jgi:pimeloyl-ACP methyl ester carboxylesterase
VPHRTLICWGLEAKTTPPEQAQRFVGHNPRSEPRLFKHAALLPHEERAETFNEEVTAFLLKGY